MRRNFAPALIACLLASLSTPTLAATAPADAIKYRKAVMEAMAAHVSAYLLINMGKVEHQDHLKAHVDALAGMGSEVKVLFPAGTDVGKTDALPLIWKESERFGELASRLEKSSAELRDAVAANDKPGAMTAFKAIGESCKGCHDRYRKQDK